MFSTLDELRDAVRQAGDVLTVEAWQVRDAYGAERLGIIVRENLSRELRSRGLNHVPREFPDRGSTYVRLYRTGTPVGDVIEAVLGDDPDGDERIKAAASAETSRVIERIRELVCES